MNNLFYELFLYQLFSEMNSFNPFITIYSPLKTTTVIYYVMIYFNNPDGFVVYKYVSQQ